MLRDDGCRSTGGLFSVSTSGTLHPGNLSAQLSAEIERGLIKWQLRGSSPKVEVVTVAVTAMAVVAAKRHVHGEATASLGASLVQGTRAIPLRTRPSRRLEGEQAEHFLHRDLGTQLVEVDAWHGAALQG
jgi:hypothetical protein